MTDLRALLTRAGEALEPFAKIPIYHGEQAVRMAVSVTSLKRARALHAEITAALADAPPQPTPSPAGAKSGDTHQSGISDRLSNFDDWGNRIRERS